MSRPDNEYSNPNSKRSWINRPNSDSFSSTSFSNNVTPQARDTVGWRRQNATPLGSSHVNQHPSSTNQLRRHNDPTSPSAPILPIQADTHSNSHPPSRPLSVATLRRASTQVRLRSIHAGSRRVFVNLPLPVRYVNKRGEPKNIFPTNKIITSRYTPLSFIPKNLFEQFRRAANLYFLFMAVIQLIPYFGVNSPLFVVAPISFVVLVTAMKDAFEDYRRHTVDDNYNGTICHTLRNNVNVNYAIHERVSWWLRLIPARRKPSDVDLNDSEIPLSMPTNEVSGSPQFGATKWKNVRVGDFVLLRNGDAVPADCVILSTSEDDGTCYVETKDLDGETNLKTRNCLHSTARLQSAEDCANVRFYVDSEPPNPNLYTYSGALVVIDHISSSPLPESSSQSFQNYFHPRPTHPRHENSRSSVHSVATTAYLPADSYNEQPPVPINIDNILLRGHVIRNTGWVIANVIFTGTETKILLNSGEPPSKRSAIEKEMNREVITNFVVLAILCSVVAVGGGLTLGLFRKSMAASIFVASLESTAMAGFTLFWFALIIFQNIVPISLYISIEFVKTLQAYFIANDIDMYDPVSDSTCSSKSWNLSDDLGQVEYIFSDKTGTLTRNVMEFRRCSVRGKIYGDNGFSAESEGARGARLRRAEASSGSAAPPEDEEGEKLAFEAKRKREFEAYERALRAIWEPKYASLNEEKLTFADPRVFTDLENTGGDQGNYVKEFFTLLAVCHTVVVEHGENRKDHDGLAEHEENDEHNLDMGHLGTPEEGEYGWTNPGVSSAGANTRGERGETGFGEAGPSEKERAKPKKLRAPGIHLPKLGLRGKKPRGVSFAGLKSSARHEEADPTVRIPLLYKAESPDESALVGAARNLGFTFLGRHGQKFTVDVLGEEFEFETLAVLEFNSTRKRMSVLVRRPAPWNDIALFTKGADNVIMERLAPGQEDLVNKTATDVEMFSNEGLRTLTLAYRVIPENEYSRWQSRYDEAAASLEEREERLWETYEEIERDLLLLGATAIEDKLQEGVPDCIELLRKAGIKVWVLTGDKLETAINIGFASNLLVKDMRISVVRGGGTDEVYHVFSEVAETLSAPRQPGGGEHALVIDGGALKILLETDEHRARLLEVSLVCKSVICCRVSPLQKALVVEMVRRGRNVITLAIGDGANDVSMIQAANIGVGISGQEGVQASMAADYSFAQFRFLAKLIIVHGHWDYERISEMILNFFYKNVVWVFAPFWFQIFAGFSANIFYDYTYVSLYNLLFTVAPICVLGATDQTVTARYAIRFPLVYGVGIRRELYTRLRFWIYFFDAVWQSAVIYFCFHFIYVDEVNNVDIISTSVAITIVTVVNLVNGFNTYYWTWWVFFCVPLEIFLVMSWVVGYSGLEYSASLYGIGFDVVSNPSFWIGYVLAVVVCILPRYVVTYVADWLLANDLQVVRQIEHKERKALKAHKLHKLTRRDGDLRWRRSHGNIDGDIEALNAQRQERSFSMDRVQSQSQSHRQDGSYGETIEMT